MHCKLCRKHPSTCRVFLDFARRAFFALGKEEPVECAEYEDGGYHGLEGVSA